MNITLNPKLEPFVQEETRRKGLDNPSDYLNQLVEQERLHRRSGGDPDPAADWIKRIRGTATSGLSTDQIMEMTRSEK